MLHITESLVKTLIPLLLFYIIWHILSGTEIHHSSFPFYFPYHSSNSLDVFG